MKIKVLATFSFFIIYSCKHKPTQYDYHFIENPEVINKSADKILSENELKYDISQILHALNSAYSGRYHLPNTEYANLIKNISSINTAQNVADFCAKVDGYMDSVSDNHLSAKFNNKPCHKGTLNRDGQVGKNFYKEKKDIPWSVKISNRKNSKALLISIVSFPKSTSPVWNKFIETVKNELPKSDFVILDMRGNGGGDDSKGFALATLLAGAELKKPYAKQWNNPSPEAQQLFVNTFDYWSRFHKEDKGSVPQYILDLKKEFEVKRDNIIANQKITDTQSEDEGADFVFNKSIKKPVYILIDADCASSCESTTDFFEYNGLVKTVGENTAGYVHFGNNGNVILKNSGIVLQMAISYNSYKDGRFIEKKGITPKIQVPAGKDAMDFAWTDFFINQKK